MLRVLKWWLSSLRGQQYAGRDPASGVKKPLNAVLGEVFVGWWDSDDGKGRTHLVSEQVSHHPPVTACRVWNDEVGVEAEGFTRQEITFSMSSGSVNIAQMGYALFKLRNVAGDSGEAETYLIPLPDVKVKGVLSGSPYPELGGKYRIACTSGWEAEVEFSGKGFLGIGGGDSGKNGFEAKVFQRATGGTSTPKDDHPVWTISGNWDSTFTIKDHSGKTIEQVDIAALPIAALQLAADQDQDPYETRQVWRDVRTALNRGDMQGTSDAKNIVEQGQRDMRKQEEAEGKTWQRLFFQDVGEDTVAETLRAKIGTKLDKEQTVGIWKFNGKAWQGKKRPWRGGLRPDNTAGSQSAGAAGTEAGVAGAGGVAAAGAATQNGAKQVAQNDKQLNGVETESRNGVSDKTDQVHSTIQQQQPPPEPPKTSATDESVHPPMPDASQQRENEQAKLADGVADMSLKEQTAVEDYLRTQYASGR